ncbi:MAG: hypothetical protein H6Q41_1110 [Deltaproteobacteria bacterium]|jgi:hypothetical protein|nr:hypothetical protein [Deltaproteobacteria bacterium]
MIPMPGRREVVSLLAPGDVLSQQDSFILP